MLRVRRRFGKELRFCAILCEENRGVDGSEQIFLYISVIASFFGLTVLR